MSTGGFGKKVVHGATGVGPGAGAGAAVRGGPAGGLSLGKAAPNPEAELAAKRAAFLAEERARKARELENPTPAADEFGSDRRYGSDRRAGPAGYGSEAGGERSMALAYILWFFLGGFSAHRFYLGYTTSGFVQLMMRFGGVALMLSGTTGGREAAPSAMFGLLLTGAVMLWTLADAFIIPSMCRSRSAPPRPAYVYG